MALRKKNNSDVIHDGVEDISEAGEEDFQEGILPKLIRDACDKIDGRLDRSENLLQQVNSMRKETLDRVGKMGNAIFWSILILLFVHKIDIPFLFEKAELYDWITVNKEAAQIVHE